MTLNNLLVELNFPRDIELAVANKLAKDGKRIQEMAKAAYESEDLNFPLCRRRPLTRLAVVTFLLLGKFGEYQAKGIPDKVIFDTFRDVSLRAGLYYAKTGGIGLEREDVIWFRHIMNVQLFKIGVLQFQPFEMIYLDEETIGEAYMTISQKQKEELPSGAPVINCHIQAGADLSDGAVAQAFEEAKDFFSKYYASVRFKAFVCYSWLLYPPMHSVLGERSNIRRFADRFSIIGFCDDHEQAFENLFENGRCEMPTNPTTLQRVAIVSPDKFGFACGIISI